MEINKAIDNRDTFTEYIPVMGEIYAIEKIYIECVTIKQDKF